MENVHRCKRCKRPLKNPRWVALGYGSICYQKICFENKVAAEEMEEQRKEEQKEMDSRGYT